MTFNTPIKAEFGVSPGRPSEVRPHAPDPPEDPRAEEVRASNPVSTVNPEVRVSQIRVAATLHLRAHCFVGLVAESPAVAGARVLQRGHVVLDAAKRRVPTGTGHVAHLGDYPVWHGRLHKLESAIVPEPQRVSDHHARGRPRGGYLSERKSWRALLHPCQAGPVHSPGLFQHVLHQKHLCATFSAQVLPSQWPHAD